MINVREALIEVMSKLDRAREELKEANSILDRCERIESDTIYSIEVHFHGHRNGQNALHLRADESGRRIRDMAVEIVREVATKQAQSAFDKIRELSALVPEGKKNDD